MDVNREQNREEAEKNMKSQAEIGSRYPGGVAASPTAVWGRMLERRFRVLWVLDRGGTLHITYIDTVGAQHSILHS